MRNTWKIRKTKKWIEENKKKFSAQKLDFLKNVLGKNYFSEDSPSITGSKKFFVLLQDRADAEKFCFNAKNELLNFGGNFEYQFFSQYTSDNKKYSFSITAWLVSEFSFVVTEKDFELVPIFLNIVYGALPITVRRNITLQPYEDDNSDRYD